jgi:hypothetical protein
MFSLVNYEELVKRYLYMMPYQLFVSLIMKVAVGTGVLIASFIAQIEDDGLDNEKCHVVWCDCS